jgi:hypothetical protein
LGQAFEKQRSPHNQSAIAALPMLLCDLRKQVCGWIGRLETPAPQVARLARIMRRLVRRNPGALQLYTVASVHLGLANGDARLTIDAFDLTLRAAYLFLDSS